MNARPTSSFAETLVDLGLSRPEADAYLQLLLLAPDGPATGYAVAKHLGKDPTAVYRALEALRQRGAVETVDGRGRRYRPVAPDALVRLLKRDFWARGVRAREQLAALTAPAGDEEIYRLATRDQAIARFGELLDDCARSVLLELPPLFQTAFTLPLEAAVARGVEVAFITPEANGDVVLRGVFDRAQMITAVFGPAPDHRLLAGFWTANAALARQGHAALSRERCAGAP